MMTFKNLMENYNNKYKGQIRAKSFVEIHNKIYKKINFERFEKEVSKAIENFINSNRVEFLLKHQNNRNNWKIEASGYGETRIEGMKAYCKTDFIVFDNEGNCIILDWKTGKKTEKHGQQLHSYASWASNELQIPLSNIQAIVAYLLPEYSENEPVTYKDDEYKEFVKNVRKQTDEMKSYLKDVINNTPKNKENFEKNYEDKKCQYCNYYSLCE